MVVGQVEFFQSEEIYAPVHVESFDEVVIQAEEAEFGQAADGATVEDFVVAADVLETVDDIFGFEGETVELEVELF